MGGALCPVTRMRAMHIFYHCIFYRITNWLPCVMCSCQSEKSTQASWERLEVPVSDDREPPPIYQGIIGLKKTFAVPSHYQKHIARLEEGTLTLFRREFGEMRDCVRFRLAETNIQCHSMKPKLCMEFEGQTYRLKTNEDNQEHYGSLMMSLRAHVAYGRTQDAGTESERVIASYQTTQVKELMDLTLNTLKKIIVAISQIADAIDVPVTDSHEQSSSQSDLSESLSSSGSSVDRAFSYEGRWRQKLPARAPPWPAVSLRELKRGLIKGKGTLPITLFKPISLLQEMCAPLANSFLFDRAAQESNPIQRMCLVAAFAFGQYWNHYQKHKPFESRLDETYEMDRWSEMGWRYNGEKVSVEPPMLATYTKGRGWKWSENFTYGIRADENVDKLTINNVDQCELELSERGEYYVWRGIDTCLNEFSRPENFFISHKGTYAIECSNGVSCELKVKPCVRASDACRATGRVILNGETATKLRGECSLAGRKLCEVEDDGSMKTLLLEPDLRPNHTRYYGMDNFELSLNQKCDGVPPTDSRYRRDMRLMEQGKWQEALEENNKGDGKERERTKKIKNHTPNYFKAGSDWKGALMWKSKHNYWSKKADNFIEST